MTGRAADVDRRPNSPGLGKSELGSPSPFRIMPSRGQSLFSSLLFMGVGLALMVGAAIYGEPIITKIVGALFGFVVGCFGAYFFRRERRYFNAGSRYWMTVSPEHLTLVTPDGDTDYAWSMLAPFVVTRHERESTDKNGRTSRTVTYTLTAQIGAEGDDRLGIELDDFATQFEGSEGDRAEAMAAALNDLRQLALAARWPELGNGYGAPMGLVVAPMATTLTAKPRSSTPSVVQRS